MHVHLGQGQMGWSSRAVIVAAAGISTASPAPRGNWVIDATGRGALIFDFFFITSFLVFSCETLMTFVTLHLMCGLRISCGSF